jgi:hypothetical protein
MGRALVIVGAIAVIGLSWQWLGRLGLGDLPGDIRIRGEHGAFYFPITSCIVISVALSLILWLINR